MEHISRDLQAVALACADDVAAATNRLMAIAMRLQEIQPARDGLVTLSLKACRRKCLGCPHPTWFVWRHHPHRMVYRFSAHRITNPLQRLRSSGEFGTGAAEARTLVREALELIQGRSARVAHLSAVARMRPVVLDHARDAVEP